MWLVSCDIWYIDGTTSHDPEVGRSGDWVRESCVVYEPRTI